MSTLQLLQPGYAAFAQRILRPLAASKAFTAVGILGLDAAGKATPFLSGTVAGIQYAIGAIDPAYVSPFTSDAADKATVLEGVYSCVNGTSGNALAQADANAYVYTADGLTANKTSGTNPLVGGGTTTGKLLGTFLGFDPNVAGNVLISVLSELNSSATAAGVPTPVAGGGTGATTAAGARTNLGTAQVAVETASTTPGAGGGTAPAFTGSAPASAVNLAAPVFSGTGMTASGQAMTSTDNQTMTLNQCAGMWLVCAGHGPYLIASNTAVIGAPAVLTIYGGPPITDAGTYKVLTGVAPAGTVASHTHTGAGHTHTQS